VTCRKSLKDKKRRRSISGALMAGAKITVAVEEGLKAWRQEVTSAEGASSRFIDRCTTSRGGQGRWAMDASNMLKPALARGERIA